MVYISGAQASCSNAPESAKIEADHVVIEEEIGRGGMANVFKGTYRDQRVAVKKCMMPGRRTKDVATNLMETEAKIHVTLSHDNVVRMYGYFYKGMALHIVAELMDRSLESVIYPDVDDQYDFTDDAKMFICKEFTQ